MPDVPEVLLVIGMWTGGLMIGLGVGGEWKLQHYVHTIQQIQILQSHGVLITVTDNGKMWGWDDKHRISYQIKDEDLNNMVRGLK